MHGRTKNWILKHETILLVLGVVMLLRIPSLFEPYWYGDEGIYLTIGQAMRKGVELYKDIHDNKPPFLYLVASVAQDQFLFRLITAGWSLATIWVFAKLAKNWWKHGKAAVWTTVVFGLLTSLPFIEGNVANAELYFLLLTVLAFGIVFRSKNHKMIWAGGMVYGLAALFKIPAGLEAGIWPVWWLMTKEREWFRKSLALGAGVALPLVVSVGFFAWRGTLPTYLIAAGIQNVPYLANWRAVSGPIGTLTGRAGLLVIWLVITWLVRNKISPKAALISVWWGVTLFAVLLSGRPYPHYLLQMAPVVALGIGMLVWGRKTEKITVGVGVVMLVGALAIFKFYAYRVANYYINFGKLVSGMESRQEYYRWFNPAVNRNYVIAETIAKGSQKEEKVFIWGDEPMIYALAKRSPVGKYTVRYHIKDFGAEKETVRHLREDPPRYIVVVNRPEELPGLSELLVGRYVIEKEVEGVKVYRRFDVWKI